MFYQRTVITLRRSVFEKSENLFWRLRISIGTHASIGLAGISFLLFKGILEGIIFKKLIGSHSIIIQLD